MNLAHSTSPDAAQLPRGAAPTALRAALRHAALVLQVDAAVSRIDGLAWLAEQRGDDTAQRLDALRQQAATSGWDRDDLTRARLACLRPRRAEIAALGRAYLEAVTPGAVDAAHALRRAGIGIELSGEVAAEALLGVAGALGVTPDAIHAPRLRFDALGAYTGCEVGERASGPTPRVYVGTRTPEPLAAGGHDHFVRFTGAVAHEGPGRGASVASFPELAELLVG